VGILALLVASRVPLRPDGAPRCGDGFFSVGARCCPSTEARANGACAPAPTCPSPLVLEGALCLPPPTRVLVPATQFSLGPSDWEAQGRVAPRTVRTNAFYMDVFEASVGRVRCATCPLPHAGRFASFDAARAESGLTLDEARRYCTARGGRVPTDDEWLVAASGAEARRYPWGDTGAVCRRAAWGLGTGPCFVGPSGPDTAGAHADGATRQGIHDLAGNVAEWVETQEDGGRGRARGGSYASSLATELRNWAPLELESTGTDPRVGVRCAYDAINP
jgi:formylglycine-generating enzyme